MHISRHEVTQIKVSCKKLFKLFIDRDMKKREFCKVANIFSSSITKLVNGKDVSVNVLERICVTLRVDISNIMELIPDEGIG